MRYYISEDANVIHLLPPKTLPEAITAGLLGIGCKALAYNILGFTVLASLAGLLFGYINISGDEAVSQPLVAFLSSFLPGKTKINLDDLKPFSPSIILGTIMLLIGFEFLRYYLTKEGTIEKRRDEFARRLKRNSALIAIIYVFAIATAFFAPFAEGTISMSTATILAGFCIAALISNAIFVAIDTFAHQLIWHAGARLL
jgi:hypothetical protein